MWRKFNPNPRGCSVGDCAIRAISAATGRPWESAFAGLMLEGFLLGDMPSANRVWGAYLERQGFSKFLVKAGLADFYTVSDFARDHPDGVYVLGCSGHVLTIIDGDWWDSWDSGHECPIYFWQRKGE